MLNEILEALENVDEKYDEDHEIMRINTMSDKALLTRVGKMNRLEKLEAFIRMAKKMNRAPEAVKAAEEKLKNEFADRLA